MSVTLNTPLRSASKVTSPPPWDGLSPTLISLNVISGSIITNLRATKLPTPQASTTSPASK
nr:MAG TPA: hypothetical protein [Caudoviricetes sp.]